MLLAYAGVARCLKFVHIEAIDKESTSSRQPQSHKRLKQHGSEQVLPSESCLLQLHLQSKNCPCHCCDEPETLDLRPGLPAEETHRCNLFVADLWPQVWLKTRSSAFGIIKTCRKRTRQKGGAWTTPMSAKNAKCNVFPI